MSFFKDVKKAYKKTQKAQRTVDKLFNSAPSPSSSKQIPKKTEAEIMFPQYLKIIDDSVKLVNATVKPDVFFSRYDLLIENLRKASQIENHVRFSGERPSIALSRIISIREEQTSLFIRRSFEKMIEEVEKLKTPKGKGNRVDKYFSTMDVYKDKLSTKNVDLLNQLEAECREKEVEW